MGLDENAGYAHSDCRAREHWNELPLAAGGCPLPSRLLHGMRRVEDHRRPGGAREDRQRAHVGHERVVAEGCAALGDEHVAIAGAGHLGDDIRHVPWRQELALLDIDHAPRGGCREEKIGLTT